MRLAQLTESLNIKRILSVEAEKLQSLAEAEEKKGGTASDTAAPKVIRNAVITTKIVNYGKFLCVSSQYFLIKINPSYHHILNSNKMFHLMRKQKIKIEK